MNDKVKFFDGTFKLLTVLAVCVWALYFALIFFVGENKGCVTDSPDIVFTVVAWTVSFLSGLPIMYGLARLLFWPNGPKNKSIYWFGWIISFGVGLFIAGVILFALAMSQYGC